MRHDEIDQLILSLGWGRWQKVAMLVAKTQSECEQRKIATSPEDIAHRVAVLVDQDLLEAQGDISNWRHSEVRLPGK
jgi:hypothetical protein